jgi:rRNA-processing protein FCF1
VAQVVAAVDSGRIDQPVVVVLEGKSRLGVPSGLAGGITVIHAEGSGDDALVDVVAREASDGVVTLVTADRELRRRAEALGAGVVGPSWLLHLLER